MSSIPNQLPVWNKKHAAGDHETLRHQPSPLAKLTVPFINPHSYILELGCGVGRDAEYFNQHGHKVIATDSSDVVIEQNIQHFGKSNIQFEILDMLNTLPYQDETFDMVYANLSLHYYSDADTKRIINNVKRALKPEGLLAFSCKSIEDSHHGIGEVIEENIFVSDNGHVRHLFSEKYTKTLLKGLFKIEYLDIVSEVYNGQESSVLRCIAKNI